MSELPAPQNLMHVHGHGLPILSSRFAIFGLGLLTLPLLGTTLLIGVASCTTASAVQLMICDKRKFSQSSWRETQKTDTGFHSCCFLNLDNNFSYSRQPLEAWAELKWPLTEAQLIGVWWKRDTIHIKLCRPMTVGLLRHCTHFRHLFGCCWVSVLNWLQSLTAYLFATSVKCTSGAQSN